MTPAQFTAIRDNALLTRIKLGELICRDQNTVARYERGELPIPAPVARLMQVIEQHGAGLLKNFV